MRKTHFLARAEGNVAYGDPKIVWHIMVTSFDSDGLLISEEHYAGPFRTKRAAETCLRMVQMSG